MTQRPEDRLSQLPWGRALWAAVTNTVNMVVGGTSLVGAAAAHSLPVLALGGVAYLALVATLFLGVPTHQNTKLKRNPVESFATIDRFDGQPLSRT